MQITKVLSWIGGPLEEPVGLPTQDQALYSESNTDGSRKLCANCVLWVVDSDLCFLHGRDVCVSSTSWCPRHTFGRPFGAMPPEVGRQPLDPATSGLVRTECGAACALCTHYRPTGQLGGLCRALKAFDPCESVYVGSLCVCSRWEAT